MAFNQFAYGLAAEGKFSGRGNAITALNHETPAQGSSIAMLSLQARHTALLTQRMVRAGKAPSHRVGSNQQQEVIPANGCGPVGLVMRCAK